MSKYTVVEAKDVSQPEGSTSLSKQPVYKAILRNNCNHLTVALGWKNMTAFSGLPKGSEIRLSDERYIGNVLILNHGLTYNHSSLVLVVCISVNNDGVIVDDGICTFALKQVLPVLPGVAFFVKLSLYPLGVLAAELITH